MCGNKMCGNKIRSSLRGKTYEEIYGHEEAIIQKNKRKKNTQKNKGKINTKLCGKTYEEIYGHEEAIIQKNKRKKNTRKNFHHTEKTKEIIRKKLSGKTSPFFKNIHMNDIKKVLKNFFKYEKYPCRSNFFHSYHIKKYCCVSKLRRVLKEKNTTLDIIASEINKSFLNRTKGRIGIIEEKILDNIEKQKQTTILRQIKIGKYYIDGYDRNNNIVYEVDEQQHKYTQIQDYIREQQIKKELNCNFVRIKV